MTSIFWPWPNLLKFHVVFTDDFLQCLIVIPLKDISFSRVGVRRPIFVHGFYFGFAVIAGRVYTPGCG